MADVRLQPHWCICNTMQCNAMAIRGIWNDHNRTDRQTDERTNETNERSHRWTHTQTSPNERWKAATIDTLSQRMPKRKKALHSDFFSFCCFFHIESNRNDANRIHWKVYCIHRSPCLLHSPAFKLDKEKRLDKKMLHFIHIYMRPWN